MTGRDTRYHVARSSNAIGHNNRSIVLPVLLNIMHASKKYPWNHVDGKEANVWVCFDRITAFT